MSDGVYLHHTTGEMDWLCWNSVYFRPTTTVLNEILDTYKSFEVYTSEHFEPLFKLMK